MATRGSAPPSTLAEVECHEGRQIVFVDPSAIPALDLTDPTRALFPTVLSAHTD